MAYGRKSESKALKSYSQFHIGICNKLVDVESKGLQVNSKHPFLGASVDGIVECPLCGVGVIEIKCPFKWRNSTPIDCCKDSSFYCENVNGKVS